ncbi:MAG: hypothetical protein BWK77_00915 [Verrucomicrobia bacterium A1]|nr:MAG: hypothetical protein BWK77_00915 [Verrucomicrobia bacterium A1]
MNRRAFVRGIAAGAAVSIVPARVLGRDGAPPSAKLNIAGIGGGRQGLRDLQKLADENIVALCDVDPVFSEKARKEFPKASFHTDWRAMLEKEKGIDAVLIATPDHTHAVIAAAAMKAGKHVFCEKPLTHNIREARMKEMSPSLPSKSLPPVEGGALRELGARLQGAGQGRRGLRVRRAPHRDLPARQHRQAHAEADRLGRRKNGRDQSPRSQPLRRPRLSRRLVAVGAGTRSGAPCPCNGISINSNSCDR